MATLSTSSKRKRPESWRYLITGAQGFIGTWIVKYLLEEQITEPENIIATDLKLDNHIFSQVFSEEGEGKDGNGNSNNKNNNSIASKRLQSITRENLDICDWKQCQDIISKYKPHVIIHLAALQVPTCRVNPILGAQVNVLGTLNIFEAVKQFNEQHKSTDNNNKNPSHRIYGIVYASSAGICGPKQDYQNGCAKDDDKHTPRTHYGYFKLCNEGNARVYYLDHGINSIGLRPLTVYGVGREIGLTSDTSKAIKASVLQNIPYQVRYKGNTLFHYVKDMARLFVECAQLLEHQKGAFSCNIGGHTMSVEKFLELLYAKLPDSKKFISIDKNAIELPFPDGMEQDNLTELFSQDSSRMPKATNVSDAMDEMIALYQNLKKRNLLDANDLKQ